MRRVLAVALLLPVLAAGCGGSDQESYCDAVEDHQTELTEIAGSDDPAALLEARDILGDLRERAPRDIASEWRVLLESIDGLQDALEAAGVDPATYDPKQPPADVTEAEEKAIRTASARLASPEVAAAFEAVDQQVRDVCHTPLTL